MLKARHFRHPLRTLGMAYDYYSSAFYDWRHGIRTTDIEPLSTLELTRPENLEHANSYSPSEPAVFRAVFRNLQVNFSEYCFVDFGCGKGRVLAEAARHPFKAVIGIDFAKELCNASRANLDRVRSSFLCADVQVLHRDATDFDLPPDPCVAYIYNSFRGTVLTAALERIQKSVTLRPRHVRIAYVNPMLAEQFLQVPGIRVFKSDRRYVLYDLGVPQT
jgi:SAM-dependent methyltransferase